MNLKLFLILLISMLANIGHGETNKMDSLGQIDSFKGQVSILKKGKLKPQPLTSNSQLESSEFMVLFAGDRITTGLKSEVTIVLQDNSVVIVPESSILEVQSHYQHQVIEGHVGYFIRPNTQLKGFKVKTKAAIIGVKGTKFIARQNNSGTSVFMVKGNVAIESIKSEFIRYQQEQKSEFDEYSKSMNSDFNQYKKQMDKGFKEYVKSISIKNNEAISINQDNEIVAAKKDPTTISLEDRLIKLKE